MEKIYLLSSGSYSDYGVNAVFSTKELAEEFIKNSEGITYDKYTIEERQLNPTIEIIDGKLPFIINMYKDGTVEDYFSSFIGDNFKEGEVHITEESSSHYYPSTFHVRAKNKEHAIKIANEKRLQIIAANRWIEWETIENI